MELKDLSLMGVINDPKALKAFSEKGCTGFGTKHSKYLFANFNVKESKFFHITDTTKERIKNVPVEEINGCKLIDLKQKQGCGCVYFNDGLHFIYVIKQNGVYIMTSSQRRRKIVNDPTFYAGQMMSGFLYYDFYSDYEACYINNLIDALNKTDHSLHFEPTVLKEIKNLRAELNEDKKELYNMYVSDYNKKHNETRLCLQAFIFIHFAKVMDTTRISQDNDFRSFSDRLKNRPLTQSNIIRVDTRYDETLNVINPFSVKGHYRNQPCGTGRTETKLIYIDDFMKKGYTRLATKEKINL